MLMTSRVGAAVSITLFFFFGEVGAQTASMDFTPPVAGRCFNYLETSPAGVRERTSCIKEVSAKSLKFDSGVVLELPSFNVLHSPGNTYLQRTGALSTEPGCWPVGAACGGGLGELKDVDVQLDGKVVLDNQLGRLEYPKFTLVVRIVDCDVLGSLQRCLRSEITAVDRFNNGSMHDVKALRVIALTGEARGVVVVDEYSWSPGSQRYAKLLNIKIVR